MDFIGLPQYCKAFLGRCDVIASSTIAKTIDPHTYISRRFFYQQQSNNEQEKTKCDLH